MSDEERTDSSSDGEDVETSGLIATRQKRVTAGNLYATLRANLDDEELQKELLAEEEEGDAGEYEGSDKSDDDDALESSSDEEDTGPPKEGEAEELDGERALKRQERADAVKKRRAHEARLKIPALQRMKKRVKLADDAKTEDGGSTPEQAGAAKKSKKSERANWLPTAADAPTRQSGRASAVANREVVHANLKQSAERSEKQRRVMRDAAEREKSKRWMVDMTQQERLKKCERIERETAREFGRWEREEAERQRARDEAIAAKRKRVIDGPLVRHWSGSVLWEGEKIKVRRMGHGSVKVEEVEDEKDAVNDSPIGQEAASTMSGPPAAPDGDAQSSLREGADATPSARTPTGETPAEAPVPSLHGTQESAAQPQNPPTHAPTPYIPSAPMLNGSQLLQLEVLNAHAHPQPTIYPPPPSHLYPVWPPTAVAPSQPPAPLLREQAARTLVILSSFPSLTAPNPTKRIPKSKAAAETTPLDPTPLKSILVPSSHPTFTPEESKYLLTRPRKHQPLPPAPLKARCALTTWPAKFRDPKTGLAYADLHQYKVIQRVLAGGTQWSRLLGCWVGPRYGAMGRPAKGVPEGFAGEASVGT